MPRIFSPEHASPRPSPMSTTAHRGLLASAAVLALSLTCSAPVLAGPAPPVPAPLDEARISMQAQEKDQWCWAASGNTIADYHGAGVTQTKFCQLAHNESGSDCANKQGYLEDAALAFDKLGFSQPGQSLDFPITFGDVQGEISADRPIETRIGWNNGGGHMHVVYGFGQSGTVSWGDPWPSSQRYSTASYDAYVSNNEFQWTHTLAGIGK